MRTIRETNLECQKLCDKLAAARTLSLMIIIAWQIARIVAVALVEEVLAQRAQAATAWGKCPACGKGLESKGMAPRQIRSMIGLIKWRRRLGRCPHKCAIGQVAPLDEELGLKTNQKSDTGLQRAACLMAIFVPFETAGMLLQQLSGVTVSSPAIWQWVQVYGQQIMDGLKTELLALSQGNEPEAEALSPQLAAQTLVMGSDGVMVPFRPQKKSAQGTTRWREVKVAIMVRLSRGCTRAGKTFARLQHHRVAAVLGNVDDLSERMWLEALKQGIRTAPQVVWLSDGGRGFWRLFEERFSSHARGVLDFYHAAQNLWSGAKAWLDGRTHEAKAWFKEARHRLRHGQSHTILADIEAALLLEGLPESAHQALTKLYNYLDKHRDHIQYDKLKELGLPIGSGLVESTCKWLIQQRFKGVGMRWSEDGFNHLLHLRLAWVNGRFDAFFPSTLASPKS
jgi:hypothetical protein